MCTFYHLLSYTIFVKLIYQKTKPKKQSSENYVFWRGSEKFSNLPKITQLLKGGAGNETQVFLTPELVPVTRVNICPLFTQMNKSISISKGDINKQYKIYPRHKDFRIRRELSGPRVLPPPSSAG